MGGEIALNARNWLARRGKTTPTPDHVLAIAERESQTLAWNLEKEET